MTSRGPGADPYDEFAYPGRALTIAHPARLEVVGRLLGLEPTSSATCRVLELGCGDGTNAMSIAQTLPGATVVGIDLAAEPITRGRALAARAGLGNVDLRCTDLEALDPSEFERFDYVIAHGVYSWIPAEARSALLECCRRCLAPDGIAYVSYNAYPGSHLRNMVREIQRFHVRSVIDPAERLQRARALLQAIAASEDAGDALRAQAERALQFHPALLVHDDLAEVSKPFYFHEFAAHAADHELQFLAEAELALSYPLELPEEIEPFLDELGDDVIAREQYLDFFQNRAFRETLLCPAAATVRHELDDAWIAQTWTASSMRVQAAADFDPAADPAEADSAETDPGTETFATPNGLTITTSEPHLRAVLHALAAAWPRALSFATLLGHATGAADPGVPEAVVADRLREVLLAAARSRMVTLYGSPPPLAEETVATPVASPLARAQYAEGETVLSTLRHASARLDDERDGQVLALLDGAHDRDGLAAALGVEPGDVERSLTRFAAAGLLVDLERTGRVSRRSAAARMTRAPGGSNLRPRADSRTRRAARRGRQSPP